MNDEEPKNTETTSSVNSVEFSELLAEKNAYELTNDELEHVSLGLTKNYNFALNWGDEDKTSLELTNHTDGMWMPVKKGVTVQFLYDFCEMVSDF